VDTVFDSGQMDRDSEILRIELIHALERARSRFAIAIAGESKSTPCDLRMYYLDTADRMRRFVTGLRNDEGAGNLRQQNWEDALEALRKIPMKEGAYPLCNHLRSIVTVLSSGKS